MKKLLLIALMFTGVFVNAMNIKAVFQGPLCNGDATGTISLVMDGGNAPFTYAWSNGASTRTISNLHAGSYTVTVTDNAGTSAVSTIQLAEPFAISITDMVIGANPAGASNGSISLTLRGGTPDFSYLWSNGETTKDISNLPAGDYTVIVSDAAGCQATLTSTVQEPLPQLHIATVNNQHLTVGSHGEARSMETDVNTLNNLSVYPNPASSSINMRMQAAQEAEYTLLNANGEVVIKQSSSGIDTKADVSNLPAGNYVMQVKTARGTINKNVVIAK